MKRILLHILPLLLILIITAGCSERKSIDPSGIYLAGGGKGYFVIERSEKGDFTVRTDQRSFPVGPFAFFGEYPIKWDVRVSQKQLLVDAKILHYEFDSSEVRGQDEIIFTLIPSKTVPGDWDIVSATAIRKEKGKEFKDTYPVKLPLQSSLHKIDDERLVSYFKSRDEKKDFVALLENATRLLETNPDDVFVRILYLDALFSNTRFEEMEEKIKAWRDSFKTISYPYLEFVPDYVDYTLDAWKLSEKDENAYDFLKQFITDIDIDLQQQLSLFTSVREYNVFKTLYHPNIAATPSFYLPLHRLVKVHSIMSIFYMLQGEREKALNLLCADYHLSQLLISEGFLLQGLIGAGLSAISTGGLELFVLNSCETQKELEHVWQALEQLQQKWDHHSAATITSNIMFSKVAKNTLEDEDKQEAEIRFDISLSLFQLLRMMTAAKHRLVTTGNFPRREDDFAPMLPDGLPNDPFGDRLMFIPDSEPFVVYSFGPDKDDDYGRIEYDSTNGTVSRGDIIRSIPREREFPFPRKGVKAKSTEEFRNIFPNGLPPDPFASTKGRQLGVTDTLPVLVYSFGPDHDEAEWEKRQKGYKEKTAEPDADEYYYYDEAGKALGQDIINRQSRDHYQPEPMYDPTNGISSKGDLFLIIPEN